MLLCASKRFEMRARRSAVPSCPRARARARSSPLQQLGDNSVLPSNRYQRPRAFRPCERKLCWPKRGAPRAPRLDEFSLRTRPRNGRHQLRRSAFRALKRFAPTISSWRERSQRRPAGRIQFLALMLDSSHSMVERPPTQGVQRRPASRQTRLVRTAPRVPEFAQGSRGCTGRPGRLS